VKKLLRFTDHIVFSFDGDNAGRRAAGRALEAALPHVNDLRSFRFLFLPSEHDPDSYVRELGAEAFEAQVAAAVPLSEQLIHQASDGVDLQQAEGRARMLAQAKPLWMALATSALKTQILASLARTAQMPLDELSGLWGLRAPAVSRNSRFTGSASAPREGRARPITRTPQDQLVRLLMTNSGLWDQLSADDHEVVAQAPSWHGHALRWLERHLTEHGVTEWPVLRQCLDEQGEPFAQQVLHLVDGAELVLPASAEDLRSAIAQLRRSLELARSDTLRLLGRG
jgi:DNA primase